MIIKQTLSQCLPIKSFFQIKIYQGINAFIFFSYILKNLKNIHNNKQINESNRTIFSAKNNIILVSKRTADALHSFPYELDGQDHFLQGIQEIKWKLKAKRPELFLVKSMEDSIYKKQAIKVVFTRKELSEAEFQSYLRRPDADQEKFMVEIKCVEKDVIGRDKVQTYSALMLVKFAVSVSNFKPQLTSPDEKQQKVKKMGQEMQLKVKFEILSGKKQLNVLEGKENKTRQKEQREKGPIELPDVILILIMSFLVGFSFLFYFLYMLDTDDKQ